MRHRTSRLSAFVSAAVAVLAAFVLTTPRDADEGARPSAVRMTRGALQRLDTGDLVWHGVDEHEPVTTPAADGVGDVDSTGADSDSSDEVAVAVASPGIGPDWAATLAPTPAASSHPLARPELPAFGRAPPARR